MFIPRRGTTRGSLVRFFLLVTALFLGLSGGQSAGAAEEPVASSLAAALDGVIENHYKAQVSVLRVLPGNITWGESDLGSGFSRWIGRRLQEALISHETFSPVAAGGPVFGNPQAALLAGPDQWGEAEYLLSGSYRLEPGAVVVTLGLFSFIFAEPVGAAEVRIPLSELPGGLEVVPENAHSLEAVQETLGTVFGESSLDVYVTTSRGEGGVYQAGEELILYLLASRDCYVKVFHISGDGEHLTQIFPNQYEQNNRLKGGRYLKFPGDASAFRFRLTPPLGAEYIKVIASTEPFQGGRPFEDMGQATRGLMVEAVGTEDEQALAEARVSYTIIAPGGEE